MSPKKIHKRDSTYPNEYQVDLYIHKHEGTSSIYTKDATIQRILVFYYLSFLIFLFNMVGQGGYDQLLLPVMSRRLCPIKLLTL